MQIETQVDQVVLFLSPNEAHFIATALEFLSPESKDAPAIRAAATRASEVAEGGRA